MLLAAPLYGPWNGAARLAGSVQDGDAWLYGWTALWVVRPLSPPPFLPPPPGPLLFPGPRPDAMLRIARPTPQYAELSNLVTHLNLASLRPKGTKTRAIPRGYGFDRVSCANYWFETVAWGAFTGLTLNWAGAFVPLPLSPSLSFSLSLRDCARGTSADSRESTAAALFSAVAVGQMYVWALKKHRRYRKEFGDKYPRGRKGASDCAAAPLACCPSFFLCGPRWVGSGPRGRAGD